MLNISSISRVVDFLRFILLLLVFVLSFVVVHFSLVFFIFLANPSACLQSRGAEGNKPRDAIKLGIDDQSVQRFNVA